MTPDLLSVVVRALGFVSLFQAVGAALFLTVFASGLERSVERIRRLARIAAAAGVALTLAHLALEPARMAGDFDGLWDHGLQQLAVESGSGASQLLQAAGLLVIGVAPWGSTGARRLWVLGGGLLALGAFLLTGHTSAHPLRAVLAPLLALHVLVVAFWFGSLGPLVLVSRVESNALAAAVLRRFTVLAGWLVPLILFAGLSMGWILAGSFSVLRRPYGELLLAKLAGFALLLTLAAANRWRFVPALAEGGNGSSLRTAIAMEYGLIVAILATTAVLTAYFSPADSSP
jgi:putative copper resistance protein D